MIVLTWLLAGFLLLSASALVVIGALLIAEDLRERCRDDRDSREASLEWWGK